MPTISISVYLKDKEFPKYLKKKEKIHQKAIAVVKEMVK